MDRKKINELYKLYGFTLESEEQEYSVYLYEQGYFSNIEIVAFSNLSKNEIQQIKEDYMNAGYSVSIREEGSYDTLKNFLFKGFFRINESKNRVKNDYLEFCKAQELGGIKYNYILPQYLMNGEQKEKRILDDIYDIFQKETVVVFDRYSDLMDLALSFCRDSGAVSLSAVV